MAQYLLSLLPRQWATYESLPPGRTSARCAELIQSASMGAGARPTDEYRAFYPAVAGGTPAREAGKRIGDPASAGSRTAITQRTRVLMCAAEVGPSAASVVSQWASYRGAAPQLRDCSALANSPAPKAARCGNSHGPIGGPGSKPRKRPDWKRTNSRRSVPILGMTSLRANLRAEGRAPRCSTSSAVFGWRLTVTCESRLRSLPPLPRADRNRRAARDRVFRCASCRQHCAPAAKVFCDTGAQPRSAAAPAQMPG